MLAPIRLAAVIFTLGCGPRTAPPADTILVGGEPPAGADRDAGCPPAPMPADAGVAVWGFSGGSCPWPQPDDLSGEHCWDSPCEIAAEPVEPLPVQVSPRGRSGCSDPAPKRPGPLDGAAPIP